MSIGKVVSISSRLVIAIAPSSKPFFEKLLRQGQLVKRAFYYFNDARLVIKYMHWEGPEIEHEKLRAELIFQYHKLEKGLCMPGPKRFFGADPAKATLGLIRRWNEQGFRKDSAIYLGAIEALRSYRAHIELYPPQSDGAKRIAQDIDALLKQHVDSRVDLRTPMPHGTAMATDFESLNRLMLLRRSVRSYTPQTVDIGVLRECINSAQYSPSACNRQPWRVHIYTKPDLITALLQLQNGNHGFGHQLSRLLIITVDMKSFFDGTERHEPYIDGGLFSMSLILALQAHGISSCCLNWCVKPDTDVKAHLVGAIPEHERIVMYLAVGHAAADAMVPRSARKGDQEIVQLH